MPHTSNVCYLVGLIWPNKQLNNVKYCTKIEFRLYGFLSSLDLKKTVKVYSYLNKLYVKSNKIRQKKH